MNRIQSVDALRVLAIVAVIGLHTAANSSPQTSGMSFDAPTLVNNLERFAVPLFFILSGYFWAARCTGPRDYLTRALALVRRVLLIFLAWSLIYLALPEGDSYRDHGIFGHVKVFYHDLALDGAILKALFEGPKVHLWFLPGLACAALISGALLALRRPRLLLAVAIALFAVGLAGSAYAGTPLGFHSTFSFRDGPFFGLLFFVTGYFLAQRQPRPAWLWIGLALAGGGLLLQLAEAYWLHRYWQGSLANDFVIGTYPFGLGIALIALSDAPLLRAPAIAAVGPLVLGIYASQYLFVDLLRPIDDIYRGHLAWDVAYVGIVFALALGVSYALSRFHATRRIVM